MQIMIIQSHEKPDLLLPDMTFLTKTINQSATEIYKNYNKVLCPTILYAEIYNDASGAKKRLKNPFEVLCIAPWQILVREELEGRSVTQDDNIILTHLISEQNMGKEEKEVAESIKERMINLDKKDRFLSDRHPISMGGINKPLVSFTNAVYQKLLWDQFIEKFQKVSKGTIFEVPAHISKHLTRNKNKTRTSIEKALSKYAEMYPINDFKKAFALSRFMLEKDFAGTCDRLFIPMLENCVRLNKTHWNNTRDNLTDSRIRESFPYTWYALYHYLAFRIYQNENIYNKKVGSRDFEYLYYLYFPNILFVSADTQHEKYITGAEVLKSRHNSSFAYIPSDRDQAPEEHDKVMKYIKDGVLY